jgi:hypothetical protein
VWSVLFQQDFSPDVHFKLTNIHVESVNSISCRAVWGIQDMPVREPREDPQTAEGYQKNYSLRKSSLAARHIGFDLSIACCVLQAQRTKPAHGAYGRPSEPFPCCPRYQIPKAKPFSAFKPNTSKAGNNFASCANKSNQDALCECKPRCFRREPPLLNNP